eukprot:Skav230690  [mRNA]  locus=scaffold2202:242249:257990:- [translate_table: standard]
MVRGLREHRKSREEEERKVQERLLPGTGPAGSKGVVEKLSAQISALVEDMEKSRAAPPERAQELARSLAQLDRRQAAEEQGRHQASIALQRALDALREDLLGEVKERRQQGAAVSQEVQSLQRNWQLREDKAEVAQQQLQSELSDMRERVTREVPARDGPSLGDRELTEEFLSTIELLLDEQLDSRLPQRCGSEAMLTALGGVLVALSTDPDYTLGQMLETLLQKPP